MKYEIRTWVKAATLLSAMLLSMALTTNDVQAQSRERGRSSSSRSTETSREKRTEKQKKAEPASKGRSPESRTSQERSRQPSTPQRETRSEQGSKRTERSDPRTERSDPRTESRGTQPSTPSPRTERSPQRESRTEGRSPRTEQRTEQRNRGVEREGNRTTQQSSRGRTQRVDPPNRQRPSSGEVQGRRSNYRPPVQTRPSKKVYHKQREIRPPSYRYPSRSHHHRPNVHIDVDIHWPWVYRHERRWAPRYRYRQVVYVEAGWGNRHRSERLDVRTYYRHEIRRATRDYAEVDIFIDQVELYQDGRFLGTVDRIPSDLARIRATIYRDGDIRFDRDVFIVGDPYVGFEMISTRHYNGYLLNDYRRDHGYRVGRLDLRRGSVHTVRHSRLFDPYGFDGYVPFSLLPEDAAWLWDYGYDSVSAYYDDYDYYYGARGQTSGASVGIEAQVFSHSDDRTFRTQAGASIRLQREREIERLH